MVVKLLAPCYLWLLTVCGSACGFFDSSLIADFNSAVLSWTHYFQENISLLSAQLGLDKLCNRYSCIGDLRLMKNHSAQPPVANGCGSYSITVPRFLLPELTKCCDEHDLCYSNCGVSRAYCDGLLSFCFEKFCRSVAYSQPKDWNFADVCWKYVRLMEAAVNNFGCVPFLTAQSEQCYCG
ncbi:Group XIIA secretory phospholipase A2 [Trichinella nelsoni]|uniref:Group XIIA secretory phospholipase A2 n=7 Tax=Trichinella TaxID=6333 RepID=A0A0V1A0W9_9BILA|nr:putative group XIIA secretory phospholipase A2 [Trichinella spiralis]KRX19463.1 Group XIIA secretory phospholipase A2 [Trichinella nelsoni]KRX43813.1 Group XIIA secretory phospholipase A2 [Trichinella murrelli]KRX75848.1 Group XIIA secretory phospholipase A2 [Trichinella sp. T6]KRY17961.1 Group XIIA secretory phospholipase A2 [Trichinella patagoniensis]KRY55968.1 Group XIIA secretory phospholipase A2 [Trichinella britovi]KRZ54051.1 Group XIIA secretory phospholipase A2 [Trichinella nativa]